MLPPRWPKRLIDINVNKLTEKDLTWADSAFISAMAVQRESARQVIARCRRAGLKVIAGGPLFSDEHAAFGAVDHFILMNLKALHDGYKKIVGQIYSPKTGYERVRTLLKEYKAPKTDIPLDFQRLLAFFRSSIRLGVLGKERFHYWKLLLWTLHKRPQLMPLAITFAIYGHHFRKVCEIHLLYARSI
jgi:hypothetical protein